MASKNSQSVKVTSTRRKAPQAKHLKKHKRSN
jgi:hypothetical protein